MERVYDKYYFYNIYQNNNIINTYLIKSGIRKVTNQINSIYNSYIINTDDSSENFSYTKDDDCSRSYNTDFLSLEKSLFNRAHMRCDLSSVDSMPTNRNRKIRFDDLSQQPPKTSKCKNSQHMSSPSTSLISRMLKRINVVLNFIFCRIKPLEDSNVNDIDSKLSEVNSCKTSFIGQSLMTGIYTSDTKSPQIELIRDNVSRLTQPKMEEDHHDISSIDKPIRRLHDRLIQPHVIQNRYLDDDNHSDIRSSFSSISNVSMFSKADSDIFNNEEIPQEIAFIPTEITIPNSNNKDSFIISPKIKQKQININSTRYNAQTIIDDNQNSSTKSARYLTAQEFTLYNSDINEITPLIFDLCYDTTSNNGYQEKNNKLTVKLLEVLLKHYNYENIISTFHEFKKDRLNTHTIDAELIDNILHQLETYLICKSKIQIADDSLHENSSKGFISLMYDLAYHELDKNNRSVISPNEVDHLIVDLKNILFKFYAFDEISMDICDIKSEFMKNKGIDQTFADAITTRIEVDMPRNKIEL